MQDIKIASVEIPAGSTIAKTMGYHGPCFAIPAVFTLEDGRKLNSSITSQKKKNVMERVNRTNDSAKAGSFFACFNEKGEFWGTKSVMSFGG